MKTHITLWLCCCITWFSLGQSITELEYFFNTDPGFGNANTLTPNANSGELSQSFNISPPTDATGFNTLYIRAKDDTNTWSLYANSIVFITDTDNSGTATELTAAEYFINTDPGFGNATALPLNTNTGNLTQSFPIPIGASLSGFNTIYIRTQDDLGNWSLYDNVKFFVTEEQGSGATSITALEYFIDTDPGFGNATSVGVNTNTGSVSQSFAIPLVNLDEGFHNLYIRTQDDFGEWSLYDKRLFFVTPEQNVSPIVAAEYFYDVDPGLGNGTSVVLQPTGNLDEFTVDLSTADITCDFHDFYIRLINEDGSWSLYDYGLQIEVFDNADPTIVVFNDITVELDASGQGSLTIADVDNGTFDDCELVSVELNQPQFDYTCADLGTQTVTVTATDAEAKVSTLDVAITVVDLIDPVALAQNITVQLNTNGQVTITADDLENGSTDNCSITSRSVDVSSFDCSNLGDNLVNFTVTDSSGNTNTVQATVTVEDSVNPEALTQNITVQLDASGNATITADDVDQSTDNCSIVTKALDITSFDCSNLGANTVNLTVTDQSGNSASTTATVTVEDSISPTVITQDVTVQLDSNGTATITTADIENGSTDNCGISSLALDIDTFDCSNLGSNTVTLTVTDQSGNSAFGTANVTVEDGVAPTVLAQNITLQLDATGSATLDPALLDNGSSDNCGIASFASDITLFSCSDIGANTVNLTVTDTSGNTDVTTATVTVEDGVDPSVITQNISIGLDSGGIATITVDDIDNGSSDNCGIATRTLDITTFDCSNLGANTVTLNITDVNGRTGNATATVTVTDSTDPLAVSQNITLELDVNGNATLTPDAIDGGSSDNCGIDSRSIDVSSFSCVDLGANTVNLTVFDASGNSNTTSATVTVEDNLDPIALGQDITIGLEGNPSVSIVALDVDNGSSDNCGINSYTIDVDTFTAVGTYPVVLTVTDASGNSNSTTVTVTVEATLGLSENSIDPKRIDLHPNPTQYELRITTDYTISQFSIYDALGKEVLKSNNSASTINVQGLSNGVYFIKLSIGSTSVVKRFIKQ
ncbi:T9SS type A sorting domain-containing protein [Winogradskyella sp. DF17]|uniref:T9SS type A sorting domain-containing protein n=1 Tax=Winogradskyella pelagia TaxID=2819984 RepID=A0ABS3T0I1_9FLAO|nr:T9SS type A sorting domain-containing protein [Winogradskyella sp. DF17]MBO3116248.1 T9SS type A sorting domain-containing protein [Winogradskyella sp. DF17]